MFFIISFPQMCLYSNVYDAYLFLEISENKTIEYLTYYINNDLANVMKIMRRLHQIRHCAKSAETTISNQINY